MWRAHMPPARSIVAHALSLDYLIRAQQHLLRDVDSERLCGFEIDHQLEDGGLLDGQVARLGAAQDFIDIDGGAPELLDDARCVCNESASAHKLPELIDGRNAVGGRERDDLRAVRQRQRIGDHEQGVYALLAHRSEGRADVLAVAYFDDQGRDSEDLRCGHDLRAAFLDDGSGIVENSHAGNTGNDFPERLDGLPDEPFTG